MQYQHQEWGREAAKRPPHTEVDGLMVVSGR